MICGTRRKMTFDLKHFSLVFTNDDGERQSFGNRVIQ
jgi:hypothetical protein